jgi:hypothetical protein
MDSEQRLVEAVRRLATPGPDQDERVSTVHLSRYAAGDGQETWLQLNGPDRALSTVVHYFGYDYHVIGLDREHLVLLVTEDAAAAYARRRAKGAELAAAVARRRAAGGNSMTPGKAVR